MGGLEIGFGMLVFLVVLALAFNFLNGLHDAANSIATVVSTGVLKPHQAVLMAGVFNFVALGIFHLKVATTVGCGQNYDWDRLRASIRLNPAQNFQPGKLR
jgi:PiT family inorganic phosphate transporter